MSKKILAVGNCGFDHGNLQEFASRHFNAEVTPAHDANEAKRLLGQDAYDLVLVNRKFDRDGGDGIELIRQLTSDPAYSGISVMLLSNYPEYQQQAVAAGATQGFGKADLGSENAISAIQAALA